MFVKTEDAEGFAELQESFGVPTPTTYQMTEYFGLYHADRSGGFWSHDPLRRIWQRHDCEDPRGCQYPSWLQPADRMQFSDVSLWAAHIARPEMPDDPTVAKREEPFLYSGYIFQWLFIPELGRWELLPLGKHDAAETAMM